TNGNIMIMFFGLLLSIPVVIFGSVMISNLINRWPVLVFLGAGLLGYTSGEMILREISKYIPQYLHNIESIIPWVFAFAVVGIGYIFTSQKTRLAKEAFIKNDDDKV
ncbi:MAG: hypothetical protein WCR27_01275, partial [Eubacteriales bacterium]